MKNLNTNNNNNKKTMRFSFYSERRDCAGADTKDHSVKHNWDSAH